MEWIISGLVGLLACWCGYCVFDHFVYISYYSGHIFKSLRKWHEKLMYATYQIVSWVAVIAAFVIFFTLVTVITNIIIFG